MVNLYQVIKIISGFFDVVSKNKIYRLRASGTLRDNNLIPIVGDYVEFKNDLLLTKVKERKNFLIRPKVANVDLVAIIVSLSEPKFSSLLLDRFLAIIESQNINTLIIFTKSDLGNNKPYYDYLSQNFNCLLINNKDKDFDWNKIKDNFRNKLTVFTGQTGVGKTSTLNNLLNKNEKTNEISKSLGRGKHTTRVIEIFCEQDIRIIDTPGFSSLENNLSKLELAHSFFDFKEWSKKCKFSTCIHYKEIDCEVKRNYQNNILLKSRYENYIKMLLDAKD